MPYMIAVSLEMSDEPILLFRSLWCYLNFGSKIKDILLIDNGCQDWFIS